MRGPKMKSQGQKKRVPLSAGNPLVAVRHSGQEEGVAEDTAIAVGGIEEGSTIAGREKQFKKGRVGDSWVSGKKAGRGRALEGFTGISAGGANY